MKPFVTICHAFVTPFCDSAFSRNLLQANNLKFEYTICHNCHVEKDKDIPMQQPNSYLD